MIASFSRSSGENLSIEDDGGFELVRYSGRAVGRFAGTLEPDRTAALREAVVEVTGVAPPGNDRPWASGATVDRLYGGDGSILIEISAHEEAPDPWSKAVRLCRAMMDDLTAWPSAAVGIELQGRPIRARLAHQGTGIVTVVMDGAAVEAAMFGSDGALLGSWTSTVHTATHASEDLRPGWSLDVPLQNAGSDPAADSYWQVKVTFELYDGRPRQAVLSRRWP